jgi:hypothetical protein
MNMVSLPALDSNSQYNMRESSALHTPNGPVVAVEISMHGKGEWRMGNQKGD